MTDAGTVAVGFLDPGEWAQCFGQSLIDLYLGDAFGPRRMIPAGRQLRVFCSTGGVPAGRNEIAEQFLDNTPCEWLFMVDSDMGFPPDTVERLIAAADHSGSPVVGGLCFALRRRAIGDSHGVKYAVVPTIYDHIALADGTSGFRSVIDYPRDEIVPAAATGAACLLIHRSVLEQLRTQHGDTWFNPIGTFSEDLSFCIRIAAIGAQLAIDTGTRTTHYKGGVFLDEEEFDRGLALASAPLPTPA